MSIERRVVLGLMFCFLFTVSYGASAAKEYVPGEIIVKMRDKGKLGAQSEVAFVGKAVLEKGLSHKRSWSRLRMHHFAVKPGSNIYDTIAELNADPAVEYAEPNYIVSRKNFDFAEEVFAYEDIVGYGEFDVSKSNSQIQANESWDALSDTTYRPIVAVIDSGTDLYHPVFQGSDSLWINEGEVGVVSSAYCNSLQYPLEVPACDKSRNGVDDSGNGYVDDVYGWNFVHGNNNPADDDGHGTHVAGIVLSATQSITEKHLDSSKIQIMSLKFLNNNGSGKTSDAIEAVFYAINNGARVINASWGGGGYSQALVDALVAAYDANVFVSAASGNSAQNNDSSPIYPASYNLPNLLSVAATDSSDNLAFFSNFGFESVHLGAPGLGIWSTLPDGTYGNSSGTSMAAPFIAGIAALLMREVPDVGAYQVKETLMGSGDFLNSLQSKVNTESRVNFLTTILNMQKSDVWTEQPEVEQSSGRSPSSLAGSTATGGCGTIMTGYFVGKGSPPKPPMGVMLVSVLLLMIPLFLAFWMRQKTPVEKRQYERYHVDSRVRLRVGGKELQGVVSSLSVGGAQINADTLIARGGIVSMKIESPDGAEQIEVAGRVVWSDQNKSYGVQFSEVGESASQMIRRWTRSLIPEL